MMRGDRVGDGDAGWVGNDARSAQIVAAPSRCRPLPGGGSGCLIITACLDGSGRRSEMGGDATRQFHGRVAVTLLEPPGSAFWARDASAYSYTSVHTYNVD